MDDLEDYEIADITSGAARRAGHTDWYLERAVAEIIRRRAADARIEAGLRQIGSDVAPPAGWEARVHAATAADATRIVGRWYWGFPDRPWLLLTTDGHVIDIDEVEYTTSVETLREITPEDLDRYELRRRLATWDFAEPLWSDELEVAFAALRRTLGFPSFRVRP